MVGMGTIAGTAVAVVTTGTLINEGSGDLVNNKIPKKQQNH